MRALLLVCWLLFPLAATAAEYANAYEVETRADGDPEAAWQRMSLWAVDPQQRLIWVRIRFTLSDSVVSGGTPIGVHVSAPVAYQAWWNGTYIGQNGVPGADKNAETPGRLDSDVWIPPHTLRIGDNELLLKMSSFHLSRRLGTPMQSIELREAGVRSSEWSRRNAFRMAAAGALLLGAVYFGALFMSNRAERSSLLLSLLSLSVLGQLLAESARHFTQYFYPAHIIRLDLILGFAATSATLLVAYVAHRFAPSRLLILLASVMVMAVISAIVVPGYDGKTLVTIICGFLVSGVAAIMGWRNGVRGAVFGVLAIAGAIVIALADVYRFIDQSYYLSIVGLLFVLFAHQVGVLRHAQRVRAEEQLRSARLELELLKQQIQPHFLMNTLTALSEWIESDPTVGVKMIEALGDELRAISAMSSATTIPLGQELALCRHHLRVMGFRQNRRFTLHAEGLDFNAPVPPAIFHTLLENAFSHNNHADGTEFRLTEETAPDGTRRYRMVAPHEVRARAQGSGKGHAYVRARLRDAFGENWKFMSGPTAEREWADCIEMPRS